MSTKPKEEAQKRLGEVLSQQSGKLPRKQICRIALSKCSERVKKKHMKKAWRTLEKDRNNDDITHHDYETERPNNKQGHQTETGNLDQETLPFAEMLRRKQQTSKSATTEQLSDANDLDEQIRRLEEDLAKNSQDESDVSDSDENDVRNKSVSFGTNGIREIPAAARHNPNKEGEVICLSSLANDRIAPLPETCLPQNKKRVLKGIDADNEEPKAKKKSKQLVSDCLRRAVKEVLDGYVARSSEKLPFYCRACSLQLSNKSEFYRHRESEFHRVAVEMERKASYCKLCHKQFTSPVQLREHLTSRPHRQRLQMVSSRQSLKRDEREARGTGRTRRQWC